MPTYEYKCDACGKTMEQFQSMTAPPLKKCPACHKSKLRRLIGAGAGLIFKGSGFYITDYRSESYKSAARSDSGSGGSSAAAASPASPTGTPASSGSNGSAAAPATPAPAKSESKPAVKKPVGK